MAYSRHRAAQIARHPSIPEAQIPKSAESGANGGRFYCNSLLSSGGPATVTLVTVAGPPGPEDVICFFSHLHVCLAFPLLSLKESLSLRTQVTVAGRRAGRMIAFPIKTASKAWPPNW